MRPRRRRIARSSESDGAELDNCEVSFVAGRLRVELFRDGKLVETQMLDIDAVEKLARDLDELDGPGGGTVERAEVRAEIRAQARSVGRQLRTLAFVLRVARELWSAPEAPHSLSVRGPHVAKTTKTVSLGRRARRIRIATTKRSS